MIFHIHFPVSFLLLSDSLPERGREENVAPYVSEMELWACRMGDWIGLGYMLSGSVSRWGTECLDRAGRRWGKVLGLFRIFSCLDFISCLLISLDLGTVRCLPCLPAQTWLIPSPIMRECG